MKNPRFLYRILTERERIAHLIPEQIAGKWAAKEAFAKAVGRPMAWQDVEVLKSENGKPILVVRPEIGLEGHFLVSISHVQSVAVAAVVWEKS